MGLLVAMYYVQGVYKMTPQKETSTTRFIKHDFTHNFLQHIEKDMHLCTNFFFEVVKQQQLIMVVFLLQHLCKLYM